MKRRGVVVTVVGVLVALLSLVNASWLANPSSGRPTIIAQRGVHQLSGGKANDTLGCNARHILPPRHRFIENTLPSINAAVAAGADVVELDLRETADGDFVLFHDATLECRTDGSGLVGRSSLAQLKKLDVGYGYSTDGGQNFPLRGAGRGLLASLDEALRAFPQQRFLLQLKDGRAAGTDLAHYIDGRQPDAWNRIVLFGDKPATMAVKMVRPDVGIIHDRRASKCTLGYFGFGWTGHIPQTCRDGTVIVPINLRSLVWGWPNRFLDRMKTSNTQVMMIGSVSGLSSTDFTRLNDPAELRDLPTKFDGFIWTDRIELVGPSARQRWPL